MWSSSSSPNDRAPGVYRGDRAAVARRGGAVCGAVIVSRNVTEQKRAYQALIDSEQMAQSIIDSALDAFVQTDESCIILDWSPHAEALMGWTRAEAIGASVDELVFPPPQRALHRQWVDQFLSEANGDTRGGRYETPLLHKDGREFFAEVSLTALRRGDRFIINAFVRDITAKRAAEEQLFQAQKMESVGQLTGGIAHDFNNMLTVITGTIEILAEGVKDNPALTAIAKMIDDAADRAAQLTANLLAFARKQPLRPLETDVNALVEEVVQLLLPTLGRQVEIETAFGDLGWPALVDRSQLSSALVNLAINARDAMPDGGRLVLRTNNVSLDAHEAAASGLSPGRLRRHRGCRYRRRHSGRHPRQDFRAVLFDQAVRNRLRARTEHGVRIRQAIRRQHPGVQRGGQGRHLPDLSAEGRHRSVADSPRQRRRAARRHRDHPVRRGRRLRQGPRDDKTQKPRLQGDIGFERGRGARSRQRRNAVRSSVHRHHHARQHERPAARGKSRRIAAAAPGALHLRQHLWRPQFGGAPGEGVLLLTKPYRKADLARMVRLGLDRPIDHVGDPIPTPYSVLPDVERFLRENPPKA